jgi:hypothetical protein
MARGITHMTKLIKSGEKFSNFAMLYLDELGRFIEPLGEQGDEPRPIVADELDHFFKRYINLAKGTTDVFVWVHGWQNDEIRAITTARRLFANLDDWFRRQRARYSALDEIIPAFVAVHWPSNSTPGPLGYRKIRNRAKRMTTAGEAEFFLASLLGYLDAGNKRDSGHKVLVARDGYYVHCLGHSFGGRFLAAAIQAAATPAERDRKVLAAHRDTGFPFNVDSLCVLQMAAGAESFGEEFSGLLKTSPLCGPVILTYSTADRALCTWHGAAEAERGIGCKGATAPADHIGWIEIHPVDSPYSNSDFSKDITNVNASRLFRKGGWAEGGHSDFFHAETLHLITSVVEQIHRRIRTDPA